MTDFWNRKLGPAPQPRGIVVPAQQPQQQYVPVQVPQQPQYAPQPQQQYMSPQDQAIAQAQAQAVSQHGDPNRQLSLKEAVSRWRGGEAWRTEGHLACPGCGSMTSYTQYSGMGGLSAGVMGNRPRGHCFTCGYNGAYAQGDPAAWG